MTLFRELPEANKDKFIDISLQQQNVVRSIFLDVGYRAQVFLTVILLLGVVLVSLLIHNRATAPHAVMALACFMAGLVSVGFLHATNFETSRLVLLRATNRLRQIFRSEVPVETADTPPISLRWTYLTSGLAYLAFLLWIAGAGVAFTGLVSQPVRPVTAAQPAIPDQSSNPTEKPLVSSQQAREIKSAVESEHLKWSVSDTVATISGVVAFLQFLALIATYWVMRNTGRRQLRAYALTNSFALLEGSTMKPPIPQRANEPFVVVEIKNFGQTPAYRMVSWADMAVIEPINEDKLIVPPLADVSSQTLPTNGHHNKVILVQPPTDGRRNL